MRYLKWHSNVSWIWRSLVWLGFVLPVPTVLKNTLVVFNKSLVSCPKNKEKRFNVKLVFKTGKKQLRVAPLFTQFGKFCSEKYFYFTRPKEKAHRKDNDMNNCTIKYTSNNTKIEDMSYDTFMKKAVFSPSLLNICVRISWRVTRRARASALWSRHSNGFHIIIKYFDWMT